MLDSNDEPWDVADDVLAISLTMNVVMLGAVMLLIGAVIVLYFWDQT